MDVGAFYRDGVFKAYGAFELCRACTPKSDFLCSAVCRARIGYPFNRENIEKAYARKIFPFSRVSSFVFRMVFTQLIRFTAHFHSAVFFRVSLRIRSRGVAFERKNVIFLKKFKKRLAIANKICYYITCAAEGAVARAHSSDCKVGVDYGEGPPVPIPNTEVKLTCAEDTWLETARENR